MNKHLKKAVSPMEIAHYKFALIAPVIQGLFPDESASAYYRRVTEVPIKRPDGTKFLYSPRTLEKWTRLYLTGGMDALMARERSDKGSTRVLSDEAIAEIYQLKEKYPRVNATQIHNMLIKDGIIPITVNVAAVQRFFKKHDLRSAMNPNMKDRKAFEEAEFGCMWQADTCYLPYLDENGRNQRTYVMMIIDDHSRFIVGGQIFYKDNAENFQTLLRQAVATYGIPTKLMVDNGAPYNNEQLSFICGAIGCSKIHNKSRDAASKCYVKIYITSGRSNARLEL